MCTKNTNFIFDGVVYCQINEINALHPNIHFTMECEQSNTLSFLDLKIRRLQDGSIEKTIYHKPTWSGQYLNFNSFSPIQYKKGLIKTLAYRIHRLCSKNVIETEIAKLKSNLLENGYPSQYIVKHIKQNCEPRAEKQILAEKKNVFLNLTFKGDNTSQLTSRRLQKLVMSTFPSAKLNIIYHSKALLKQSNIEHSSNSVISNCVYKFNCTCSSMYIGRTERRLSDRINEHVPKKLWMNTHRKYDSSIAKHLLETGHIVDPQTTFTIISRQSKPQLLRIAEAVAIQNYKPDLCIQKEFVVGLHLPWG